MPVADFASAHRRHPLDLVHRVGREVVVEHVRLVVIALDIVDVLDVELSPQRRSGERLRFAAREERRAVHARQDVEFAGDLAYLVESASAYAHAVVQD